MEWFIAVLAVAALGVAAVAAAGGVGSMSEHPVYDTYRQDLPERQLAAAELRQLRFGIAWRGYAMDQVDEVIDRLVAEIASRDATIAELRGEVTGPEEPRPEASAGPASESLEPADESAEVARP